MSKTLSPVEGPAPARAISKAEQSAVLWGALFCTAVALLMWSGDLGGRDAVTRYTATQSMLRGSLNVDWSATARAAAGTVWYRQGPDGHIYADYPLTHSLLMLPLALLPHAERAAALLCPLLFPLLVAMLYLILRRSGFAHSASLKATLVVALGTMVLPYAVDAHNNFLQAFFVVAMFLCLLQRGKRQLTWVALAGVALGALLNVRLWAVAAVPMGAFLLVDLPITGRRELKALAGEWLKMAASRTTLLRLAAFLGGFLPLAVLYFWYEWVRFGHPLGGLMVHGNTLTQSRPHLGLLGLLVSPSKAILLFSPPLVLALVGLPRLYSRAPRVGIAVLLVALSFFTMNGFYFAWHADVCWGPRYFLPAVPLLGLGLAAVFEPGRPLLNERIVQLVVVSGLLVQFAGATVHPFRFFVEHGRRDSDHNGPAAAQHLFSVEESAFLEGLLAVPDVLYRSYDGWAHGFRVTDEEARTLDAIRRDPRVPLDVKVHADRQYLLRANKRYSTATYWWVRDRILPTSQGWPAWVGFSLPLLLAGLAWIGWRAAARPC